MRKFTLEDANHPSNQFLHHNFMTIESIDGDTAVGRLDIHPESLNPANIVHGGGLYTLADDVAGTAVHTDDRLHLTQSSSFYLVSNQGEGVVRAYAKVRRRGRATSIVDVDIRGDNDRLLATGTFSYFCVNANPGDSYFCVDHSNDKE